MFERSVVAELAKRVRENRDFIQILVGPRQTGKSTAIGQMLEKIDIPYHLIAADDELLNKPALLKALFGIGAAYSALEVSYTKIMGQLQDAGNTTTIAHYLDLLDKAGMLAGLQKYSSELIRSKKSSPRLMVHDTSLMTYSYGSSRNLLLMDTEKRGHLVESAVGTRLIARSKEENFELFWWRSVKGEEVDFVLRKSSMVTAIEVKSGRMKGVGGLRAFLRGNPQASTLIVGEDACPLEDFLLDGIPLFVA